MMLGDKGLAMIKNLRNPLKYYYFAWRNLPSLNFWSVRVIDIDENQCMISLPYIRTTKNPFKSIYFAAMMGAGELSTGVLCMAHLADRGKWSMLVTKIESEFYKKTSEKIFFTCNQGYELNELFDSIEQSGNPGEIQMISTGKTESGEMVVKIWVTWSFKKSYEL